MKMQSSSCVLFTFLVLLLPGWFPSSFITASNVKATLINKNEKESEDETDEGIVIGEGGSSSGSAPKSNLQLAIDPVDEKPEPVDPMPAIPRRENSTGQSRTKATNQADGEDEVMDDNDQDSKPTRILRWGSGGSPQPRGGANTAEDPGDVDQGDNSSGLEDEREVEDRSSSNELLDDTEQLDQEGTNIGSSTTGTTSHRTTPPGVEKVRRWGAGSGQSYTPSKPKPTNDDSTAIPNAHAFENHRDGFQLAARVYIGTDDQLSHFDDDGDITLPYYDCNAAGSTTSPLAIENAFFRHSIAAPTAWHSDPQDPHATLVVALRPFRMELDSGETKDLEAGDVVLLEDAMKPGHKMIVTDQHEMTMLFLTIRSPHYRTGKENLSLQTAVTHRSCSIDGSEPRSRSVFVWNHRRIRLALVGTLALSVSTLAADALAKAFPLWLSVGLGGVCFVVGMTVGLTSVVEWSVARFHVWSEQQRLYPNRPFSE